MSRYLLTALLGLGLLTGLSGVEAATQAGSAAPAPAKVAPAQPAKAAPAKPAPAKAPAVDPKLQAAINRVQAAYGKLTTLSADFSQKTRMSSVSRERVDSGRVEFKRGGKMRWDFQKPDVRQFVSDGQRLWIYSQADKQVIVTDLDSSASRTALNFMFGLGDLTRDFSVALATQPSFERPGMTALTLTPKENIGTLKTLTVLASDADGLVREAFVVDHMGSSTHLQLTNLKTNGALADERFSFKTPEGVEEIRSSGF